MDSKRDLPDGLEVDERYGFIRLNPIPSEEEVERFYAEEFYARIGTGKVNDSSLENMVTEEIFHQLCFEDYLEAIRRNSEDRPGQQPMSVFDIGCGYGYWLKFLQEKGFEVSGIEPVQEGVDWARSNGLSVDCHSIEKLSELKEREIDVVSLLNVLEHLRDPAQTLVNISRLLRERSGLLLVKVPNEFNPLQLLVNETYSLDNWWVARPQHINYFSTQSLSELLQGSGFEVLELTTTFPMELFLLLGEIYVGDADVGKKCHQKRVEMEVLVRKRNQTSNLKALYRSFASIGVGREIIVIARVAD